MELNPTLLLAILATMATKVSSQLMTGIQGVNYNNAPALCGGTLDDANSTGVFKVHPGVAQGAQSGQPDTNGRALDIEWAATVYESTGIANASAQWSLWFSSLGANYSNDFGLGYDVCAFTIEETAINTVLRGQNDNGSCLSTFNYDCVNTLETMASDYALSLTFDSTLLAPRQNQTAKSLPIVCKNIAQYLQDYFPQECKPFMNTTIEIAGAAMTSPTHSGVYDGCKLQGDGNTYNHITTLTRYTLDNNRIAETYYAGWNYLIAPLMMTFMPIANAKAAGTGYISHAKSHMACIHANHVNAGSQTPPAAPNPTPVDFSTGLSGGAIAGIVVGVVVGVLLIAGAAFFFWWRKRKARKSQVKTSGDDHPPPYAADMKEQPTPVVEAPAGHDGAVGATELSPDNELRPELATQKSAGDIRTELPDTSQPLLEKEGNKQQLPPQEMLAEVPGSAGTHR